MPNIEIIVKEQTTPSGASPSQETAAKAAGEAPRSQEQEEGKPSTSQQALVGAIISVAKQQAMNGVAQYGNLTGNYVAAQAINNGLELVADIGIVTKGGPIGLIYVVSKHATNLINSSIEQMKGTREQDFRNSLLGKISTEGSRY